MDIPLFKKLLQQELISTKEFEDIDRRNAAPVSVYWDLTTLLSIGILLFAAGIGILVYQNIETIGHAIILILIAVICAACFSYCFIHAKGFSKQKVEAPNVLFDNILLLGCLLLLTFMGYLQFQYKVFGTDWRMATFIPMMALFLSAYYFDHLGVLSMAITNLAAWAGVTVAPLDLIHDNNFNDTQLIYTAIALGAGLLAMAYVTNKSNVKKHYSFTYKNFGSHILFIALLAAEFHFENVYLFWFVVLACVVVVYIIDALKQGSFYFLVIASLYGYTGFSYLVSKVVWQRVESENALYLGLIYFIASGIGLIRLLIHYNQLLKKHAHL